MTIDESTLDKNPTVAKMKLLYNNYEQDVSVNEHVTAMERIEENELIDLLLASSVMRHTMKFLQQKGKAPLHSLTFIILTIMISSKARSHWTRKPIVIY